jgi:DNA-binding transcriptional ArsR family regulator
MKKRVTLSRSQAVLRSQVIKSLAHPSRIQMVDALNSGERCVCELAEIVGCDISTASKHLSLLKLSGLVSVEKRGLNQFYSLNCACLTDFFDCVDSVNRARSRSLHILCSAPN